MIQEILKSNGLNEDQITNILNSMKEAKVYTTKHENIDERYNKLGPRAKILYAYLLSLEEDESGAIYCSRYKVAELFNCDYRTAKNTIEELIEKKLLKQEFTKIGYSLKLYLL